MLTGSVNRLQVLFELRHRGTLAAVAEALSYSPSAVSQQLTALSAEVGTPLVEPSGRTLRLTPAGEILASRAARILMELEQAEAEIARAGDGQAGAVRLATFQTGFLGLVPAVITDLKATHPDLSIEVLQVRPDAGFDALAGHDCDVLLGEEYPGLPHPRSNRIDVEELARDSLRLLTAANVKPAPIDPWWAGLSPDVWVMEPVGNAARTWAVAYCRDQGFEPDVRYESDDLLVHLRMVEAGHAVAIVPDLVWRGAAADLHVSELPGSPARRIFSAVRSGATAHPAVQAVRGSLARVYAGLR